MAYFPEFPEIQNPFNDLIGSHDHSRAIYQQAIANEQHQQIRRAQEDRLREEAYRQLGGSGECDYLSPVSRPETGLDLLRSTIDKWCGDVLN